MADLKDMWNWPLNSGSGYMTDTADWSGDESYGMDQRLDQLLDGTYTTWPNLDPVADLSQTVDTLSALVGQYKGYLDSELTNENFTFYKIARLPMVVATKKLIDSESVSSATAADPVVITTTTANEFEDGMLLDLASFDGTMSRYNGSSLYAQVIDNAAGTLNVSFDSAGSNLLGFTGSITADYGAFNMNVDTASAIKFDAGTVFPNGSTILINTVAENGQEMVGNSYYLKHVGSNIHEIYDDITLTNPLTSTELTPFDDTLTSVTFTNGHPGIVETSGALSGDQELVFYLDATGIGGGQLTTGIYFLQATGVSTEYELYTDVARTTGVNLNTYGFDLSGRTNGQDWEIDANTVTEVTQARLESEVFSYEPAVNTWNPYEKWGLGNTDFKLVKSTYWTARLFNDDTSAYDDFAVSSNVVGDPYSVDFTTDASNYVTLSNSDLPYTVFEFDTAATYGFVPICIWNPTSNLTSLEDSKGQLRVQNYAYYYKDPEDVLQKTNFGSADAFICTVWLPEVIDGNQTPDVSGRYLQLRTRHRFDYPDFQTDLDEQVTDALIAEAFGITTATLGSDLKISVMRMNSIVNTAIGQSFGDGGQLMDTINLDASSYDLAQTIDTSTTSIDHVANIALLDTGTVNATIGEVLTDSTTGSIAPASTEPYKYEIDTVGIKMPGTQVYSYQDASNVTQYQAQVNTTGYWQQDADTILPYASTGETAAQFTVGVDASGYINTIALTEEPDAEGRYEDADDILLAIESPADQYVPPTPYAPDVWDTDDEWDNDGFSFDKVWPDHVRPASAKFTLSQPSSVSRSQNGTKYVRSSGVVRYQLEVAYAPMTYDNFRIFERTTQAARGQATPFYFKLKYPNDENLLMQRTDADNTGLPDQLRLRNAISTGDKTMLFEGFLANSTNAFVQGETTIFNVDDGNGGIVTVVNDVDSNKYGEAKIRLPYGTRTGRSSGSLMYKNPSWVVVTLAEADLEYTVGTDGLYRMTVVFDFDEWK